MSNAANSITVLSNSPILQENRQDPITGDLIKEGDKVVICATCKSAFLEGSWSYLGGQHCQQTETLSQIPAKQNFKFVKKLEQVIFSAENHQGNTALIVAVPTGIISFIISILLILNVTEMIWLWGVVASLVSIPFIFNVFQTKGIEVKETAIYIKKGFGLKKRIVISDINSIDFLYYNGFEHTYFLNNGRKQKRTISTPYVMRVRSKNSTNTIEISGYDFSKNRNRFIAFFTKIGSIIPVHLASNNEELINQFESNIPNLTLRKGLNGLRYIYGRTYNFIALSDNV